MDIILGPNNNKQSNTYHIDNVFYHFYLQIYLMLQLLYTINQFLEDNLLAYYTRDESALSMTDIMNIAHTMQNSNGKILISLHKA